MEAILNYLHTAYAPQTVILYGSYADGTNREGSDFDALILAEHPQHHDVSIVEGVQLDVWVYPIDYFAADDRLEEAITIVDGVVLHDPQGMGAALQKRVQDAVAAQPVKTREENVGALAWCRKMQSRTQRSDTEGYYRWHWLLSESLEIACDLLHQPYRGPKKSLRWMENAHPALYTVYSRALQEFTQDSLAVWLDCLEELLC